MVDRSKMSLEEMLAYCRNVDGEGGGDAAPPVASEPPADKQEAEQDAGTDTPAPASKPAAPVDPSKMSVADILAAARSADKGGGDAGGAKPAAEETAPEPAAAGPAKPMDRSKMSVADMLAAARGEVSGKKEEKKASPKAAAKPTAKASPKAAAAPAASGPKDTASILAAVRKSDKPGPIPKAEAAARAREAGKEAKPKRVAPPMPDKPVYAQRPNAVAAAPASDRRGFMASVMGAFLGSSMAVGFSSLVVTHILWVLGLARFMFPNILTEPPMQFKVGFADNYSGGQVETKFKAQYGVWIVRYEYQGEQQIYALKSVCTHLGCTPNWLEGEQKFKCPCHGSGFYKDGINFEGPAPRPLERYAIKQSDDGQLEVDKSRKFNEELGQWADPASYFPV